MNVLSDGYVSGMVNGRQKKCEVCGGKALCVDIVNISMPRGVTTRATILHKNRQNRDDPATITALGLTCGCYARLHRQLAHIIGSRKAAGQPV